MAESSNRPKRGRGGWRPPDRSSVGICTKYTLFFLNFLLVIIGLALTAMGTYILTLKDKQVTNVILFFLDPACDTCLVGAITFIISFLGCMGSLREVTCFLKMYYYALCIFLFLELGVAIAMFVSYYVPEVKGHVFPKDAFESAIEGYRDDPDMQNLIDSMQEQLGCCGYRDTEEGYLDWNGNIYFNCSLNNESPEKCSVPYSCCIREKGDVKNYQCGYNILVLEDDGTTTPDQDRLVHINKQGCIRALGEWIDQHSLLIGGILLGILLPQMFVVVLSRNLIDMIKQQKSKWYQ